MIKLHQIMLSVLVSSAMYGVSSLHQDEINKIGKQIWQNEASQRVDLLVFWSEHRAFPELGIGHCIWYPHGYQGPYTQRFPHLCNYLQNHGVQLPVWLEKAKETGAPWKSRHEFLNDRERTDQLRTLLAATIDLQAQFMVEHLEKSWPLILNECPQADRAHIQNCYDLMRSTSTGSYVLVDYLNFRGDGLNPREELNGQRWGLLQLLLDMPRTVTRENVTKAFTISATNMIVMFLKNSAPDYKSVRFLHGWVKRISTYAQETIE